MSKLPYVLPEVGGDRFGCAGRPGQTLPRAGRTAPETNTASVPRRDAAPVERQPNAIFMRFRVTPSRHEDSSRVSGNSGQSIQSGTIIRV
jgi:hypothetical protein